MIDNYHTNIYGDEYRVRLVFGFVDECEKFAQYVWTVALILTT